MRAFLSFFLLAFFLSACNKTAGNGPIPASAATQIPSTPTRTVLPSNTPISPTLTPTTEVKDVYGKIFFDRDGNGRVSESMMPGETAVEFATEPGLANFQVCYDDVCAITDAQGEFVLELLTIETDEIFKVNIIDPNPEDPQQAKRFITQWLRQVEIPAYEINGVQVGRQVLDDTRTTPIDQPVWITQGQENFIGVRTGPFILPVPAEYPIYIFNFFDLDGAHPWDKNGTMMNYIGYDQVWKMPNGYPVTSPAIDPLTLFYPGVSGVQDGHDALDIRMDLLTPVLAPADGIIKKIYWENGQDIKMTHVEIDMVSFFGHLDTRVLVEEGQSVFAGQVIALSGDTGEGNEGIRAIHWAAMDREADGHEIPLDVFANQTGQEYPIASRYSLFSVFNFPIRVNLSCEGIQVE